MEKPIFETVNENSFEQRLDRVTAEEFPDIKEYVEAERRLNKLSDEFITIREKIETLKPLKRAAWNRLKSIEIKLVEKAETPGSNLTWLKVYEEFSQLQTELNELEDAEAQNADERILLENLFENMLDVEQLRLDQYEQRELEIESQMIPPENPSLN